MFKFIYKYLKSIITTLGVFYLSFASPSEFRRMSVAEIPHADKLVHFMMFFVLGLALCIDFFRAHRFKGYKESHFYLFCLVYPVLLGGIIEIVQQSWFYPRSAEWADWFADITGIVVAVSFSMFFRKKISHI